MKNKLKKGFTIVELVIVIAVIAILAAVLIPTFSSITNSARESAALQEAKSGSETILALTTGTLPEDSAFLVAEDDEDNTNDYTFTFTERKIQAAAGEFSVLNECKRDDVAIDTARNEDEGYIVYVSIDALTVDANGQVTTTNAKIDQHVANRILAALGISASLDETARTYDTLSSSRDYIIWKYTSDSTTYNFNIYWTSDFNKTLIAFMGGNVAGESADDETEVETVNVTATGATVDKTTVEKGKDADLVLTLTAAEEYAAYYTVTVGEFTTDVKQEGGKLSVKIPSQYTGSDFNITVEEATVTVAITGGKVNGAATAQFPMGEEIKLEITPTDATGVKYNVTVGEEERELDLADGKLSVTIDAADATEDINITVEVATVTVTISNGKVNGAATVEVAKGKETTLKITPDDATGAKYNVKVGSNAATEVTIDEGTLSVTLTADQTKDNIAIDVQKVN